MANRKLPESVLKAQGTFRKDRHASTSGDDLNLPEGFPEPPAYLDSEAMKIWAEVKTVMGAAGLYCQADSAKLARYCCLESEFRKNPYEFPPAKLSHLRLTERDLYLDPESRVRVGAKIGKPEESNPFASL